MYRTEYEANVGGFIGVRRSMPARQRTQAPMIGARFITMVAACTLAALCATAFLFVSLMH
jgi:hypothetical protein